MKKFDIFSQILGKAKDLPRSGWVNRGVENPETIAAHSWGMSMLVILLCPLQLNKLRCMEMASVHDLMEIITGDHTFEENISKEEKYRSELAAIKEIAMQLEKPELVDLFIEFEAQETKEAKFLKKLDKLDAVITAKYYDDHRKIEYYKNKEPNCLFDEFESRAREKIADLLKELM